MLRFFFGNPSVVRLKSNPLLSKSLITIFSPCTVGKIDTRTSISFAAVFIENLPSWGSLFSAMLSLDKILILVTSPLKEVAGGVIII